MSTRTPDPRRALPGSPAAARALLGRAKNTLRRDLPFPWSPPTWPTSVPAPRDRPALGAAYETDWARRYPVRLVRAVLLDNVLRPAVHLLAAPEVRGGELLALLDPPVVFVANHASHLDTPVLLSLLPPRLRHHTVVAAAADHFFDRRWKAHLWAGLLSAVPVERHRVNRRSAEVALGLIEDGWNLLIYPEGGRTPDGWPQPHRGGAAYLAVRSGRPVVPLHLRGTDRMLPRGADRLRRGRVTVTVGQPLHPEPGEDARALAARIERAVARLAAESRSDWWAARRLPEPERTELVAGPEAAPWRRAWARPPDPAAPRPPRTEDELPWLRDRRAPWRRRGAAP
ncbi:lysophospholipid acyltransferase family protein [Aciditerrimonas ferrireducens]|uniref:lysophospholipid acyltransferase family protein n=1 Tax=Aciditerrimonas ferrireducens TaxID=667306 RepID=UPI002004E2DB|nr:lysophospholipid acyltransferase family protein [Aciditerrimonas ferrireducens]MCK4177644.1 1-acyl-sn-glycerol-3-phosphate acyltransferase [Aciditerrimonas ferrireducens]